MDAWTDGRGGEGVRSLRGESAEWRAVVVARLWALFGPPLPLPVIAYTPAGMCGSPTLCERPMLKPGGVPIPRPVGVPALWPGGVAWAPSGYIAAAPGYAPVWYGPPPPAWGRGGVGVPTDDAYVDPCGPGVPPALPPPCDAAATAAAANSAAAAWEGWWWEGGDGV